MVVSEPLIFTLEDAAEMLQIGKLGYPDPVKTLRRWAARGMPHACIGKRIVFTREHLYAFIEKRSRGKGGRGILAGTPHGGGAAQKLELRRGGEGNGSRG